MKAFFPSDALLGRNGGDEFCILLKNYSYEDVKEKLQQFTMAPKTFSYKGKEYPFYISLGYSEYPTFASNRSQLMRCADAALYEIKLHGKNGCMAYREGLELRVRKQLGFAFRDISEHLPGAFIIYRADKEDDELFYANQEFLHMAGYKDMDELFRLTKKSFSNLIREDEKKKIEASIWKQIDNGNGNDYIHFHLRRADGSYLSVLDHGRIVESQQYGKVFYKAPTFVVVSLDRERSGPAPGLCQRHWLPHRLKIPHCFPAEHSQWYLDRGAGHFPRPVYQMYTRFRPESIHPDIP